MYVKCEKYVHERMKCEIRTGANQRRNEADVLRGETNRWQDEKHGDQSGAGHAGSPNAGQSRGQTDRDDLTEG